jgi:hypothetical protein
MIICGEVIVSIPNPKVQNWQEQNKKYKELIDWNHHVVNDKILTFVKSQLGEIKDYEQNRKRQKFMISSIKSQLSGYIRAQIGKVKVNYMHMLAKGLNQKIKKTEENDDIIMKIGLN